MFNIEEYTRYVESKIVYLGTRKNSFKKEDIIGFCCQWDKTATSYFGAPFTVTLKKVFGNNIANKPGNMSINTYLLLEFGYKRCSNCAEILALSAFCKNNSESIGFKSACRDCISVLRKEQAYKVNALTAKRRANKKLAQPAWLSQRHKQQILTFYKEASRLTREKGIKYQVDHIIPLQGKNICGLHVPWNLQVITATENQIKGIKYNDKS